MTGGITSPVRPGVYAGSVKSQFWRRFGNLPPMTGKCGVEIDQDGMPAGCPARDALIQSSPAEFGSDVGIAAVAVDFSENGVSARYTLFGRFFADVPALAASTGFATALFSARPNGRIEYEFCLDAHRGNVIGHSRNVFQLEQHGILRPRFLVLTDQFGPSA